MLDAVGVNEFEEQVYRAFLASPLSSVTRLAETLDTTPARARRALAHLDDLGLLHRDAEGQYRPAAPHTALTALLNHRRLTVEAAFNAVAGSVDELSSTYRTGRLTVDPVSFIEIVSGRQDVNRRIDELIEAATARAWVFDKPPYLEHPDGQSRSDERETDVTARLLRRGADLRSVHCPDSPSGPGRLAALRRMNELGEQIRVLPSLPFKLRIIDQVALVPLVSEQYETIVFVHTSGLLDALVDMYQVYWERATPMFGGQSTADDDDEDMLIVGLLSAGLKDQAIARQLGVSQRTASRKVTALMERLGVATRFQCGAAAAKRGWV